MADLVLKWRGDEFVKAMVPALNRGLNAAAVVAANHTAEKVLSRHASPPSSKPGEPPGYDQGVLRNSIASASPEKLGTPLRAAYGTGYRVGRFLEFGGIIRAKRGKYLAIPVDRLLARKVSRQTPRTSVYTWQGFTPTGLRGNPLLAFIPNRKGGEVGGWLVLKDKVRLSYGARLSKAKGKKSETFQPGTVVYVLKKRVTVKARPWIRRAADEARPQLRAAFVQVSVEELKKARLVE